MGNSKHGAMAGDVAMHDLCFAQADKYVKEAEARARRRQLEQQKQQAELQRAAAERRRKELLEEQARQQQWHQEQVNSSPVCKTAAANGLAMPGGKGPLGTTLPLVASRNEHVNPCKTLKPSVQIGPRRMPRAGSKRRVC